MTRLGAVMLALGVCAVPMSGQSQTAPVAQSALPPPVDAAPLDAPNPGAAGLLPSTTTGFPDTLWQGSQPQVLFDLIKAVDLPVPAMRSLMRSLILAEARPPGGPDQGVDHLVARLDWLRNAGSIEEALALLNIAGLHDPRLFTRWADLNLVLGRAEPICRAVLGAPALTSDMALRIFCAARSGDWRQAALLLNGAQVLGEVSDRQAELLTRFLDPELAEDAPALLPPVRPTPLEFRLFEALGEPLPTAPLPLAFSVLDLSGDNGWKAQIEAAERLARADSLPANRLLGLYTLRKAAASGGVWDRVRALQGFEAALKSGDVKQIDSALRRLWPQMVSARLLVPFAELYAQDLAKLDLPPATRQLAIYTTYLSQDYETELKSANSEDIAFLAKIARGEAPTQQATLPHAGAIAEGFGAAKVPDALAAHIRAGRLGEAILRAMSLIASGAQGNTQDLTDGLVTLRALGLEDAARRTALQLMILSSQRAL
jgi:hypothetical protein